MSRGRFHSFLKISAAVFAIILLFDGGFIVPITKDLSDNTILYLAGVGASVSANIEPTELNKFTAELTQKEKELAARETELNTREIAARDFTTSETPTDFSIYILSLILFILTTLIVVNYVMDWIRVKNIRYGEKVA